MNLRIPPKLRFHITGTVNNATQKKLRAEAQRQALALRQGLGFQGLSQGRTRAKIGGVEYRCTSVFGIETVDIWMQGGAPAGKKLLEEFKPCWCTYQLTEGTVLEVIPAAVIGCIPTFNIDYPTCAINDLTQFEGQRYRIEVCQCDVALKKNGSFVKYICIPPDFEVYEVADRVAVLYIEAWDIEAFQDPLDASFESCELNECACSVEPRDKTGDVIIDALDGDFLVLPYAIIESQ